MNQQQKQAKWSQRNRRNKYLVIKHYSQGEYKCACCGEDNIDFLTIDHMDGGGKRHLQSIGSGKNGSTVLHRWLIQNNYPAGYQVLCFNCNTGRSKDGICPHKKPKTTIAEIENILTKWPYGGIKVSSLARHI